MKNLNKCFILLILLTITITLMSNNTEAFAITESKSVLEFMCNDGQYVKGDGIHDDTTGIQKALNSGGTVSFVSDKYTFRVTAELNVPSNTVIDGYNATIKAKSSTTAKNIFKLVDKQNVVIKNLKIKSTKDQVRYSGRSGLSSNLIGIHISANTQSLSNYITLSNVYGENLEYFIKVDDYGSNNLNKNITLTNIGTYNCVQPIYISHTDGIKINNLNLDQATDVSKHDHHLYINGYTYNIEMNNIILRRGTSEIGSKALHMSSSISGPIENVKVTNVSAVNLTSNYVFTLGQNLKNCIIDGFTGKLSSSNVIWYSKVNNVTCTNFNVSGTVGQFIACGTPLPWTQNPGYNNLITLKNSTINIIMTQNLFLGENIVLRDNLFNIASNSGSNTFLALNKSGQTAKFIIENNKINISKYPTSIALFDIRVSYGADIFINNNTIKNISGTNLRFILSDYTTAGGTSKITFTNNYYSGYTSIYYIKTLTYIYNNILV